MDKNRLMHKICHNQLSESLDAGLPHSQFNSIDDGFCVFREFGL